MTDLEIRKAYLEIENLITMAKEKIKEAQKIADKHELTFSCDFGFGIGGTYKGFKNKEELSKSSWQASRSCSGEDPEPEWESSSDLCL